MSQVTPKTRRWHPVVTVSCALVALEVITWLLFGGRAIYRSLPDMVRSDLSECRDGYHPRNIDDIVLVLDESERMPESIVLRELRSAYAEHGFRLHLAAEYPVPIVDYDCRGACLVFTYSAERRIPLLAQVVTGQFLGKGGSSTFSHWRIWFFGAWLRVSDRLSGIE